MLRTKKQRKMMHMPEEDSLGEPYAGWPGDAYAGPDMTPAEWRDRIGVAVELRRRELFPRSRAQASKGSTIGDSSWGQIESGKRSPYRGVVVAPTPERSTLEAVGRRLQWREDWFDRLLAGLDPVPLESAAPNADERTDDDRFTAMEARLDKIELLLRDLIQGRGGS